MQSSHDALHILSNCFVTSSLYKWIRCISKQLHQAPVLGEDTDVIYLHSCDLYTKLDFTVPSLQFLRLNVVFGLFIFVSSLVERRLKCMLTAKRRILYKLDGVRFLFIVQVIEKAQRKVGFLFVGKGKRSNMKLLIEEFNLISFTRLACFECNQGSDVLDNFEEKLQNVRQLEMA